MTSGGGSRSLAWLPFVGLLLGAGFALVVTLGDVLLFDEGFGAAARGNVSIAVCFAFVWSLSLGLSELRARRRARPATS